MPRSADEAFGGVFGAGLAVDVCGDVGGNGVARESNSAAAAPACMKGLIEPLKFPSGTRGRGFAANGPGGTRRGPAPASACGPSGDGELRRRKWTGGAPGGGIGTWRLS